jgi:hypothetical protein
VLHEAVRLLAIGCHREARFQPRGTELDIALDGL